MQNSNIEKVHKSFEIQASCFENNSMSFSKKDYLDYTVRQIELVSTDFVLDVASGTCACGRSIAPFVRMVTCLDTTPAMLEVGKKEAQKDSLDNMIFVKGYAEELPFLNDNFDVVICRLAFHHFTNIEFPISEMVRVLKPGGKLVIIDMEATTEDLRFIQDKIETMRDPSHVKNLSESEILNLFTENNLTVIKSDKTKIPVLLDAWLELTGTSTTTRNNIMEFMKVEMSGGDKTGFSPYMDENKIFFEQRWIMVIGVKC